MNKKTIIFCIFFLVSKKIFTFSIQSLFSEAKSKAQIKSIIQTIFNVKVVSINSYISPGKSRRLGKFFGLKNSYKRVFVKIVCFI